MAGFRRLVHRKFEWNAARRPEQTAVVFGEVAWTYDELNKQANKFAHFLLSCGVSQRSIVGVCLYPSTDLVVSILAILKIGAAYSPLDPAYPCERLRLMLSQLDDLRVVVASSRTRALLPERCVRIVDIDAMSAAVDRASAINPAPDIWPGHLCYVVFTSGTTGIPKAVAIRHSGWWNLLTWLEHEYQLNPHSSNLLVSAFGFDISQRSLMTPLFTGSTVHLLPSSAFDVMMAKEIIAKYGIRTLHCAPSTLYLLLESDTGDEAALDSLDYVFIGGEALAARRVVDWASKPGRKCKLLHQYGVAECTDIASSHLMRDFERYVETGVPIGAPVSNCVIHILNDELAPVGINEVGEICISGAGVGAGYLNNDALNRERFLALGPERGGIQIYRTGDLGRIQPNSDIICVGRMDNQVKIRGIRLDLGDVENALRSSRYIEDAVVLAVCGETDQATYDLVAFVVSSSRFRDRHAFDERELRSELASSIPRHMIPRQFVKVDTFPVTQNGKIDRKELKRMYNLSMSSRLTPV